MGNDAAGYLEYGVFSSHRVLFCLDGVINFNVLMSIGIPVIRKVFQVILKVKEGPTDKTKQRHLACVLVKIPSHQ